MLVAVGSTNPTKIRPVQQVFSHHFKSVKVQGVSVSSGVRSQPLHDSEMYRGAYNRAKNALKKMKNARYGVGIEGGVHKFSYGWFERSLVVIMDRKGNIGIGASGGVVLPNRVMKMIKKGKNLEEIIDELFGTKKVGSKVGMFGIFTKNVVTRTSGVKHGVAFALARFLHPNIFQN